jgi:hypothetical protein
MEYAAPYGPKNLEKFRRAENVEIDRKSDKKNLSGDKAVMTFDDRKIFNDLFALTSPK